MLLTPWEAAETSDQIGMLSAIWCMLSGWEELCLLGRDLPPVTSVRGAALAKF